MSQESANEIQSGQEPQQEKMLPQSEVDRIIRQRLIEKEERVTKQLEEKYLAQLEALQKQQQEQAAANIQTQQQQRNQQVPEAVDIDQMYQKLTEKFNQDRQKELEAQKEQQLYHEMEQIANNFYGKMEQGAANYEDWATVTQNFEADKFPQLVTLLAGMDNAADVLYELSQNPMKLINVDELARRSPRMAQAELAKLAASIQTNQTAMQNRDAMSTQPPLARLQPSKISGSNGQLSIQDLKSQDWLRG